MQQFSSIVLVVIIIKNNVWTFKFESILSLCSVLRFPFRNLAIFVVRSVVKRSESFLSVDIQWVWYLINKQVHWRRNTITLLPLWLKMRLYLNRSMEIGNLYIRSIFNYHPQQESNARVKIKACLGPSKSVFQNTRSLLSKRIYLRFSYQFSKFIEFNSSD